MSAWITHVKKYREAHPGISYKEALKEAKKTYSKTQAKQKGGDLIHARIAEAVYNTPETRQSIGKYKYIGGDPERAIYESPKEVIAGLRGTTTKKDVGTDVILSVGALRKSARYKRDKKFIQELMKRTNKQIILSGHSLAGSIVNELSRELGLTVWAYNPGMSVKEAARGKLDKAACLIKPKGKRCRKAKKINIERTYGDPVSVMGRDSVNIKHIRPKKINVHSISNFT